MTDTIFPDPDRILAVSIAAASTSSAGLAVPDRAKGKTKIARAIAVGANMTAYKVGDRIIHLEYGPEPFSYEGTDYLFISASDVIGGIRGQE